MRVDTVIRDVRRAVEQIVRALAHGLTARENLSGEGGVEGQVLTNTGPDTPPVWAGPEGEVITTPPATGGGKTTDAGDLTTGTLPPGRLAGDYPGVTGVGTLKELKVGPGVWQHMQTIGIDQTVPEGWGSPLVGPIDIASGVTFDVGGVVEILG